MKRFLFVLGLTAALLGIGAAALADDAPCEIYIDHTCTTVTITPAQFPEQSQTRLQTTVRIDGIDTVDVREFSGTGAAFTLDITPGNEPVDVHAQAHVRIGERTRYTLATASFTRDGCVPPVPAPKPKPKPTVQVSKFYGDPLIDITLSGPAHFTVTGGDNTLHLVVGGRRTVKGYHVLPGHTLRVFINGRLALSEVAR